MINNHPSCKVVFGPPGTGKTTWLLDHIEGLLRSHVPPHSIAFLAFTQKASKEAKGRALKQFKLSEFDFPYYRTIHSFAFYRLGLRRNDVLSRKDYQTLSIALGVEIQGAVWTEDGGVAGACRGDILLFLDSLARMRRVPLKEVWEESDHGIEWAEIEQFSRAYLTFRRSRGLMDYTDMLEGFMRGRITSPSLHTLIVDEAQDLSALQWAVVSEIARHAQHVILAGDPDQAIFRWSGAEAEGMMQAEGKAIPLEQSHRIPAAVHPLAMELRERIPNATTNVFRPRPETGGLDYLNEPEQADLSTGTWLLLARHVHQLKRYERMCEQQGVAYECRGKKLTDTPSLRAVMTWETLRKGKGVERAAALEMLDFLPNSSSHRKTLQALNAVVVTAKMLHSGTATELPIWHEALTNMPPGDRAFFLSARRRGEKLLAEPRVTISTVHGAKGSEADNVLLMTDISKASFDNMHLHPEDEARTFYVGVTRAKENLFIVRPQTELFYDI